MKIFRLSRLKYGKEISGKGAAKVGNRWNSKGTEIIYCAESRALAMAEVLVHLSIALMPKDFMMMELDVPDHALLKEIEKKDLPLYWNQFPCNNLTQKIGDDFISENKYLLLKVPSAVVKGDFNILINPFHTDFNKIKISDFSEFHFDRRLF